jgi:hypothetical protein
MDNRKALGIVWDALHDWHEFHIGEGSSPEIPYAETFEQDWAAICESMAALHESLSISQGEL